MSRKICKGRSLKVIGGQFAAIAIAFAAVFTRGELAVRSLTVPQKAEKPATKVAIVRQAPELPPAPPKFPSARGGNTPIPTRVPWRENIEVAYNVKTPPDLKESERLNAIVNEVVKLATAQNLPLQPLSITLIDVNQGEVAAYQQKQLRFPASVIKMFWMVNLYAQLENGIWQNKADWNEYLSQMIEKSDNEAASYILDRISRTQSGGNLEGEEYEQWLNKRQQLNRFFREAGYEDINVHQKTFPIPYLNIQEPQGRELQMRGDPKNPIRNKITTQHAARLMYEIVKEQAISQSASREMKNLLARDLRPEVWKSQNPAEFNPVRAFFGESLPTDVKFLSKAGWMSRSRNEVAFVETPSGKTRYILAIFADDPAYARDGKIFPRMSRLVFESMTEQR